MKDFPFIDNTQLPSDINGALGKARRELLRAYNYNRNSPDKMTLLGNTLAYVLKHITHGLGTPDSAELTAFRDFTNDQVIAQTKTTSGFTKPKPTRAAKRTQTNRTK